MFAKNGRRSLRREFFVGGLITILILIFITYFMRPTENLKYNTIYDFGKHVKRNGEKVFVHYKWEKEAANPEKTVFVNWNITDEDIIMKIQGRTTGYVGVGFSFHNNMIQSDIIIGWIKDGKPYLYDYYAPGNARPMLDKQQDVELLHGEETETHTTIYFRRKLDTCDENDIKINWNTFRLLWAINDADPADSYEGLKYHGANRGYIVTSMLGIDYKMPTTPDIKQADILADNITVKVGNPSVYHCRLYKIIEVEVKHHMIAFEAVIQPENIDKVHHMLLYLCETKMLKVFSENVTGHPCYSSHIDRACLKRELASFSLGMTRVVPPPYVGFPFGSLPDDPMFVMIQIHYDTEILKNDFQDNSGFRIHYTSNLRPFDADSINVAADFPQLIAPGQPAFSNFGICSSSCTETLIPEGGVNIMSFHFHAHLTAHTMKFHLIRDGKEVFAITDEHYDFKFQHPRFLKNEVKLYPNDTVVVECIYNTTGQQNVITTGLDSNHEMCILHLYLYPPVSYYYCTSRFHYRNLPKLIPEIADIWTNSRTANSLVEGYQIYSSNLILQYHSWIQQEADDLQDAYLNGYHLSKCSGIDQIVKYPKFVPFVEENVCKYNSRYNNSIK